MIHLQSVNPTQIYPPFLEQVEHMLDTARECAGAEFVCTSGLRTYEEQRTLYAQGRSAAGRIITHAKPGQSYHNFGLAVDLARVSDPRPPRRVSWREADYNILGVAAAEVGLEWGGRWPRPDRPHVQIAGVSLADCRTWFRLGGLARVWQELDLLEVLS